MMKTYQDVIKALRDVGVSAGMSILVHDHPSLRQIVGGPATLLTALMELVGEEGTICSFDTIADNRDPSLDNQIEFEKRELVRRQLETFDFKRFRDMYYNPTFMALTKTQGRLFNNHPSVVFCANGKYAKYFVRQQPLDFPYGTQSSFESLSEVDGYVLHFGRSFTDCDELKLAYAHNDVLQVIECCGAAWGNEWIKYYDYKTDSSLYEQAVSMAQSKKELMVDGISIQLYKYQDVLTMFDQCQADKFIKQP